MSVTDMTWTLEFLMRIFVTGASGWIGSPSARELLRAGHQVVGLARSAAAAAAVEDTGATVVRGSLDDLGLLRAQASRSDGVVHLAFRHDLAFTGDFQGAVDTDRNAIEAFGDALEASDRPLIVAAGTLGLAPGRVGTERDMPHPSVHPRTPNAYAALALADRGIRSIVIRFAPTVHGSGDHGFMATLVDIARDSGLSGYIGDGTNRWPAVHRLDAADLVRRAVERAPAGSVVHATDDEGIATRTIAEAIGRQLGVPVTSIPEDQAADHFRFLSDFFAVDAPASSTLTRELLGWQPHHLGLIADLDAGAYTDTA
jgi:nucleoside-diphosphate-sugar epimerase